MQTTLEHARKTIESPTDEDIARALEGPRGVNWSLSLYRGEDGDCMEAMIDAGELWVEATEGDVLLQARSELDPALVKSMLLSFRDGDHAWRDMALWKEPPPRKKETFKGPGGLIVGLFALFGILVLTAVVTSKGVLLAVGFALLFPGIIAIAAAFKVQEVKRAATWTKASGRITRSELATETRQGKQVQVPRIEYEYRVGFHALIGRRINFAELIAGAQAKEALARYPVGTGVTVYYDPADPSEAVIERDLPAFMNAVWIVVGVLTAAILLVAGWYASR